MINSIDKKYFDDMISCSARTENGEYSRWSYRLQDDDIVLKTNQIYTLAQGKDLQKQIHDERYNGRVGFLSFAFPKPEYEELYKKLGGLHIMDESEYYPMEVCLDLFDVFYHKEKQNHDTYLRNPFGHMDFWGMVDGKRYVISKQRFSNKVLNEDLEPPIAQDVSKITLLAPAFSLSDQNIKKYLMFKDMNKGMHSSSDENSHFMSPKLCRILFRAYGKTSDFVWAGNKVHRLMHLQDKTNFSSYAYDIQEFEPAEINCIDARNTGKMEDLLTTRYSGYVEPEKVKSDIDKRIEQVSADRKLIEDKPKEFEKRIDEWAESNVDYDGEDAELIDIPIEPIEVFTKEDVPAPVFSENFAPDVTPSLEKKFLVGSYKDIKDMVCDQSFSLTVIDFSYRSSNGDPKDLEESSNCVDMFSSGMQTETLVILDPDNSNLTYRVHASPLKYIDTGFLMLDKSESKEIGSMFRKQCVFVHFFMRTETPRFFHSPFLSSESLFSIVKELASEGDGDVLIINNQKLSSQLLSNHIRILQAYTSVEMIGETDIDKSILKEKIQIGKNGQGELF